MAEHATAGGVGNLVDVGCPEINVKQYAFVRSTGDCTITGIFTNLEGFQIGVGHTGTISSAPITLLGALSLTALPTDATAFIGRTSADVLYTPGGSNDGGITVITAVSADMTSNPTFYPVLTATTNLHLGRG